MMMCRVRVVKRARIEGLEMAKKKPAAKKKRNSKGDARVRAKSASGKKVVRRKRAVVSKSANRKAPSSKRTAARGKAEGRRRAGGDKAGGTRSEEIQLIEGVATFPQRGMGPDTGGQSGSVQGLSDVADADSESVAELSEEGQDYEAALVSGVERATDHDGAEVETEESREDED